MLHGYVTIFSSQNLAALLMFNFLNFRVAVQEERGNGGREKEEPSLAMIENN